MGEREGVRERERAREKRRVRVKWREERELAVVLLRRSMSLTGVCQK